MCVRVYARASVCVREYARVFVCARAHRMRFRESVCLYIHSCMCVVIVNLRLEKYC